jgi:sugar phosphate isomerase/epimerase
VPARVWDDGEPEGVRQRAAAEMADTARAAARLGVTVVNGFTGSAIWHLLYAFPPVPDAMLDEGYRDFARRWTPILDVFEAEGVRFALEVHPTEIAFDLVTAARALEAVDGHEAFGFNYDPSHLAYQGADPVGFIARFGARIHHVHVKDVWWASGPMPSGVFGGHLPFGHPDRAWDFRSPGRGRVPFEDVLRALNRVGYAGPLSVEWEDAGMDREHGAREACAFVRRLDFPASDAAFDAAFVRDG